MTSERIPSSKRLADANAEAMAHYRQMRARLISDARVDDATCEVVLAMQLAVLGHEAPFKIHVQRVLALGVKKEQLSGTILIGLGVTLLSSEAARALAWLDEAQAAIEVPSA